MKKNQIKLLALLFFISFNALSQSNLQFNNVLTQFGTLSGGYGQTAVSPTYTVPVGKIWKIEKYTREKLFVNGIRIKDIYLNNTNTGNYGAVIDNSPLWLKEGDSFYITVGGPPYSWTEDWYFSLLEFNKN
jgi:hypothetical protein